jgi:DNA-binding GntR family transcriptional regulator
MGAKSTSEKTAPRHKQIADSIRQDIQSGRYKLGDKLPTEEGLARIFDTSRPTLRQALSALANEGLISRRPRTGSVVVATQEPALLSQVVTSVEELLDYPGGMYRKTLSTQYVKAGPDLASILHCPIGREWFQISALRFSGESAAPLCWTDFYVAPRYAGVMKHKKHHLIPVCEQIVEMYGEVIEQADIEVYARRIPTRVAKLLKAKAGAPALVVMRSYRGRDGEVFETTVSVHPEERYRYRFEFRRELRAVKRP